MSDNVIRRYAEAYIQMIQDKGKLDNATQELKEFKFILNENPDFQTFLETSAILSSEKFRLIEKICEGFSAELKTLLCFLIHKHRIEFLSEIIDYIRLKYANKEESPILLSVSSILDLEEIRKIKEMLQKKLNRRLKLFIKLDGNLLGGFTARLGNTFIDGSIEGSLLHLKDKLSNLSEVAPDFKSH